MSETTNLKQCISYGDRVAQITRGNGLNADVWEERNNVVAVEITWGDWKHQHAHLDYLIKEQMPELKKVVEEVTEEDGSDCYSAIHRFYF